MTRRNLRIEKIEAFIFDFDGVLTNNKVYLNGDGEEWVRCCRDDGLAFDVLRKLKIPTYIISSETNHVVSARAKKLRVPVIQGLENKLSGLSQLKKRHGYKQANIFYVGNDINDFYIMQKCGLSACPLDSHETIKSLATFCLSRKGGDGIVRELLEDVFCLDLIDILYN